MSKQRSKRLRVLIGSPIRQNPEILKEFLDSLMCLIKIDIDVDYLFIDDNTSNKSRILLNEFSQKENNVIIYRCKNADKYICNDKSHVWKENLVWKVAELKDFIIEIALKSGYDYLFLVDSDLVLNPNTLKQLIKDNKDIVSNIFWTKWKPNLPELPQVWMKDFYTLYDFKRDEKLTKGEIDKRTINFLTKLIVPGIYEVGGLGACTLISRKALSKGVNFKEIKNISFWGEDRHFCIRASALGIKLYVDTNYPAYHIYRNSDIEGVKLYKEYNSKKKIALVYTNYSGSNTVALSKLIPKNIKDKYCINLIKQDNSIEYLRKIIESDAVILTEGNYSFNKDKLNKSQIVIDLWHGFPIKAMGYVDKNEENKKNIEKVWKQTDYVGSYSEMFNDVMNKCIQIDSSKYVIGGAPRNDLLFISEGRKMISDIFNIDIKDKKVIFYMPTFRYTPRNSRSDGKRNWENYFDIRNFNEKEFNDFLECNNLILILKLHPAEEQKVIKKINNQKNIFLLTNEILNQRKLELYEVLNSVDLLITDYSSVYFDFLLLNRPIVFVPVDIKEYEKTRGFLLTPYKDWTPGPKVLTQRELHEEIIKSIESKEYFEKERKRVLRLVHKYLDGNSAQRFWKFIDTKLND